MEEDKSNKIWVFFEDKYDQYNRKAYRYFEKKIDNQLETQYLKYFYGKQQKQTFEFTSQNVEYEADFQEFMLINKKNPNKQYHLKRLVQHFETLGISLIVCRNNEGKWLTVKEKNNQGWWLPGGLVDPPENYYQAALRECKEEAGIDVEIKGILRVEFDCQNSNYQRLKVVFYAEPIDNKQQPKQISDTESDEARFVTMKELLQLKEQPPYLRGPELLNWATYVENGGQIFPLSVLQPEGSKVQIPNQIQQQKSLNQ